MQEIDQNFIQNLPSQLGIHQGALSAEQENLLAYKVHLLICEDLTSSILPVEVGADIDRSLIDRHVAQVFDHAEGLSDAELISELAEITLKPEQAEYTLSHVFNRAHINYRAHGERIVRDLSDAFAHENEQELYPPRCQAVLEWTRSLLRG